jgi:beta-lactamase regulating signal transducer with metallopeptidase domain
MTGLYLRLAEVSAWWWPRFADHLWQTTLFALVILIASFVLRRGRARQRHSLCLLASAKFIVPATLFIVLAQQTGIDSLLFSSQRAATDTGRSVLYGITEPAVTLVSAYEVNVVATDSSRHSQIYLALTVVWLAGSLAILLLWGIRRRMFWRSLRLGKTIQHGREWEALLRARRALELKRSVGLVISPLRTEPAVWRVWRPAVVLPDSIAGHLDDDELEAIMLHELVHIQRRDNLIGNLQLALCALLWFHPLVWFLSRRLFDEREQACDERVMEVCRAPEAYASSILKVVRFCFGWRVAGVIGAASGSNLRRRIENIMSSENRNSGVGGVSRVLASMLVGIALLILVGAGVYSRPRSVNVVTKATGEVSTPTTAGSDAVAVAEPGGEGDRRSSKKTKQPPPPPPPEPSTSAAPAQPPQPPQPAQAAQPAQPPEREMQDSDKSDKDKSSKASRDKIKKGELIEAPKPDYPDDIRKQKIEGIVAVVITIGNDGNVIYAKARSGPEELYAVSEAAAMKARFKPTILDGQPVKVTGVITYNFVADKKE